MDTEDFKLLHVRVEGTVAWVTIDNPPINLITVPLFVELLKLSVALRANDDLLVVVLQSANPDFFIAHYDVQALLDGHDPAAEPEPLTELNTFGVLCENFRTMNKVVICKIAGRIGGGGSELAMACDMRFGALGRAVMNQMEVPIGILPGGGGTQRLPRLIGSGRAAELILGGLDLDAETGERWGYFNRCLPPEALDSYVDNLARRMGRFPPNAVRLAKESLLHAQTDPVPGLLEESNRFGVLMADPGASEAMQRFMDAGGQTADAEKQMETLTGQLGQSDRFRLTTEGVGTLHFDQCEVWSEAGGAWSNISRGKPAKQSSTWRDIHGPDTGVNGAITGEAGPHTNAEPNAWWEVDLGKSVPCHYLVLFNRLRFHPERMDGLQVFGHGRSGWSLLWSQRNDADLERWGATLLRNLQNRMATQLAAGLPPQASMATAGQKERSGRAAKYYSFLETLTALGKIVPAVQQVNTDPESPEVLKQAVRGGLQAALPHNLHASSDELLLFPVASYKNIHVHTRGPQPEDAPTVEEIFKLEFFAAHADIDQTAPPAVAPQDGFDYISCRMTSAMTVPVTNTGLALSVAAPEKFNVKWEIWGEQADGTKTLLYDNTTVTRAIFQMQYLLEREEHPFDDLALGSRALEVEGKYGAAWMFSMYFPTDGPADEEIADYLNKVEYLSHTDGSRRAVSRTKHGYKETFRFKDKEVFTNGIQLVA
ncbi:Short-chain-enoyl-CoA hydratase [Nymphon striatum]|nr:Short-chain-enoyl-CoA hydratase [Nymphon striatum]